MAEFLPRTFMTNSKKALKHLYKRQVMEKNEHVLWQQNWRVQQHASEYLIYK